MVALIKFPFSIGTNGTVRKAEDGSDEYYAAELAHLLLTREEERELVPTYGLRDPAFQGVSEREILSKVRAFGPPVRIRRLSQRHARDGVLNVVVEFDDVQQSFADQNFNTNNLDSFTEAINAVT